MPSFGLRSGAYVGSWNTVSHEALAPKDSLGGATRCMRRLSHTSTIGPPSCVGSMQVSVSAFADAHHAAGAAGFLYGLMSAASLAAGLAYGRFHRHTPSEDRLRLILTFLACASLLPLLAGTPWRLGLALLLPAAGVAPCAIVSSTLVQSVMDRSVLTQAFTWTNSASASGIAVSTAAVGRLVDGPGGARAGFAVPLLALAAAAALTWSSRLTLTTATTASRRLLAEADSAGVAP